MADTKKTEHIVKSTLIQAYSYDSESQTLSVIFKDGAEFDYQQVPPPVMSQVFDSPGSIGSKFRKLIGHQYKFVKTS